MYDDDFPAVWRDTEGTTLEERHPPKEWSQGQKEAVKLGIALLACLVVWALVLIF